MSTTEQLVIVEQLVLQERKIVTYGWLSRHLNIHANKAKQLLYEFISEYKPSKENNVHAVYCICGLTTDNKQHTVTLVTQEKLEAARKGFIRLTSLHVYSVQPICPTEAQLIKAGREPISKAANESVLNTNKDATSITSTLVSQSTDVKESSIKPEKVDKKKLAKSELITSEKSTPITAAIKNTFSQASDKTSDIDSASNRTASQGESEASNKKEKKRKSIEVESNHSEDFDGSKEEQTNKKSKKQITAKKKDDKINDITSLLNKVTSHNELKTSNKQSKKRKSDEAINELDFEISEEGKASKKKNYKESLQNNDDNSQNKVTTKDKVVKKRKSNKVVDDLNQQEVEASKINERKDGIASFLNKVDKIEQQSEISGKLDKLDINNDKKDKDKLSVALVQNTPLTVQQKKRGRRQVLKSRSYVNERGYTVHENYHEWESFSEGESVSEKKPQKAIKAEELNITAKRGKKKKGDNGSQKSLLNFFGKK